MLDRAPAAAGARWRGGGHRVACHFAEDIRNGRITRHAVDAVEVDRVSGRGPAVPEATVSVTDFFGR